MMETTLVTGNIGIGNNFTLATLNNDRFLVIDGKELYLIGASLKDLGRKCFVFTKLDSGAIRGIKKSAFASGGRTGAQGRLVQRLLLHSAP